MSIDDAMNAFLPTLHRAVADEVVPGAVVLFARGDEVRLDTAGDMALGGPPMPSDAVMRIQSMTKPVTTVAALLAVQEGRLGLDDPIEQWLPELADRQVLRTPDAALADTEPARRPIVVRDLLTNTSGYGMQNSDVPWARALQDAGVAAGAEPVALGADEWLARLSTLPLVHQPGQGWRYHHGFMLLGILLQRLSGVPLQHHLEQAVFAPLGMVDTGFMVPDASRDRLPAAYRHGTDGLTEVEPAGGGFHTGTPPFDLAHSELVSTASDYHRFARMLADGGRVGDEVLLDAALVAEMTHDQVPDSVKTPDSFMPGFWDGLGWGYGGSVRVQAPHVGRYAWSGGQGTDFFVDADGTIGVLLTQVELGEQVWSLISAFQALP